MSYTLDKEQPIAVFDSGMGGISVLRELVKIMPNEDYIYFGDSANAPYGTKTKEQVRELTLDNVKRLFDEGVKGIVIACNTATSAAVRVMREMYPEMPIVGIEPALKPAATFMENPRVLVMATPMTIREKKFHHLMDRYTDQARIYPLPCPGLMDFVERGDLESAELQRYLEDLLYGMPGNLDAVVLGCTHYPFVKEMIRKVLGPDVRIFDGGEGTARYMRTCLENANLRKTSDRQGNVEFRNSLEDPAKLELCRFLMQQP